LPEHIRKLLLVEHDPEELYVLQQALHSSAYRLVCASTGEEAFAWAQRETPSLVVMNAALPDMSGYDTAERLRNGEATKRVPVILLASADKAAEHLQRCGELGVEEAWFHPLHLELLRDRITRHFAYADAQATLRRQDTLLQERTARLEALEEDIAALRRKQREHRLQLERAVAERTRTLAAANAAYDRLLDGLGDVVLAIDGEWRIEFANAEAARFLGSERRKLVGRPFWECFPFPAPEALAAVERALSGHPSPPCELYAPTTELWYEMNCRPAAPGVVVTLKDVTTRKRPIQEASSALGALRKAFEASPALISIRSLKDRRYVDVNGMWLRCTGYEWQEVVGARDGLLRISPSVRPPGAPGPEPEDAWADASPVGVEYLSPLRAVKVRYATKSGEWRFGLLSTEQVEMNGEPCVIQHIVDTTEQEALEKAAIRMDRIRVVADMAASLAHEIRNPLTTVRGFLQMAADERSQPTAATLALMVEELDRANAVITDFLHLTTRPDEGMSPERLDELVRSMEPMLQGEAMLEHKSIRLELEDVPAFDMNASEVKQLIAHLAKNGLEAMPFGGRLTLRTRCEDGEVWLQVADQGPGIRAEWEDQVWMPFFTTKEHNHGLGLPLCLRIAERHRASIGYESGPSGTVFTVRFPLRAKLHAPPNGTPTFPSL